MKRLAFLLLIILPLSLQAQSKFRKGVVVGPNGTEQDSVNSVEGKLRTYSGGAVIEHKIDSLLTLLNKIDFLDNQVSVMQQQISDLSSASNDVTAPTYISGEVLSESPGDWLITFSESIVTTDNDSIISNSTLTADGVVVAPDSITVVDATLTFHTPAVDGGATLKMSWAGAVDNGVRDPSGNKLVAFTDADVVVFNNSVYLIDYLAWYRGSGNFVDEKGNNDGTMVGTVAFQGDTLFAYSGVGGTDAINIGDIGLGGDFAVSFILDDIEDAAQTVQLVANNTGGTTEGFHLFATGDGAGKYYLRVDVGDGSSASFAQGPNTLVPGTQYQVYVGFDVDAGVNLSYASISIDGAIYNTTDSTINEGPITVSGQNIYIGAYNNGTSGLMNNTLLDEVRFYNTRLSEAFIDSLDLHPYRLPFRDTPATPSTSDTVYADLVSEDFSDNNLGAYSAAEAAADFGGTVGDGATDNAQIVIEANDACLRLFGIAGSNAGDEFSVTYDPSLGDSAYLSFDMRFKDGFVVRPISTTAGYGGKVGPSMAGRGVTEPIPTNFKIKSRDDLNSETGFTNRTGWKSDGRMRFYCYTPVNYQLDRNWDYTPVTFEDSATFKIYDDTEWFNVTMRIVMNDVGSSNGVLAAFVDGVCVYTRNDVTFRQNAAVDINVMHFSLYNGGTPNFIRNETVSIDNLYIYNFQSTVPGSAAYPGVKPGRQANILGDKIPYRTTR